MNTCNNDGYDLRNGNNILRQKQAIRSAYRLVHP